MSYRQTYGTVKNTIGLPIGLCGTNNALMQRVNDAALELFNAGDWVGRFARYRLRVSSNNCCVKYITWPNEVETIEAMEICGTPIGVRNLYFEFIENAVGPLNRRGGFGPQSYGYANGRYGTSTLLGDRQEVCTYEDVQPGAKKIKAYNSLPVDDGAQIILMGYDDSGNWIRTQQDGIYVDGEYLTLSAAIPPETTNFFSSITGVQFSVTPRNGDVTITQVDTTGVLPERFLSTYSYNEAIPIFRRSILSGFNFNQNQEEETQCGCPAVTALVRHRFIPVMADTDYMQIGNIPALTEMLIANQKRDNGKVQDAEQFRARAIRLLNDELRQFQGIAPKKVVSFQSRYLWSSSANMR